MVSLLISLFVHGIANVLQTSPPFYNAVSLSVSSSKCACIEQPQSTVTVMHDTIKLKNIRHNRDIIKAVANVVLYCGRAVHWVKREGRISQPTWKPWRFFGIADWGGSKHKDNYNHDIYSST